MEVYMTKWKIFWAGSIASIFGLWSNNKRYQYRSRIWILVKSIVDVTIVTTLAFRLPMLLGTYVMIWLTRPLKQRPVLRATVGAVFGVLISFFSVVAMEVIVVVGVLSIDVLTGAAWHYWESLGEGRMDWKAEVGLRRKAA
jgi:hypothetical protein